MAEIILWKTLLYDEFTIRCCKQKGSDDENFEYPEYTPNFIKLAESYGAVGIRVEKKEDIEPAFRAALENKHRPTIIEFMIDPEDLVYPMIKPGGTLEELIMDC